jgi:hypothetical protein
VKTYTVTRRFSVEVSREVSADGFGDAAAKAHGLKFERFLVTAPDAELIDWDELSGGWVSEERE